ncbi:MAG: aquaporin family protein [Bacteroidaceae bacterium]|nr:aquaporin family protein [Bacteroidaceae bacterium]MBQ3958180.1 aquaporin family protein [Bacteroidaceae bacterium]
MIEKMIFEFLGTMILILLGDGVCANTCLEKSKAKGAGWVVVTFAWGLAVMCGVFVAGPYTGAHLNPAVSVGLALAGSFDWNLVLPYIAAQMLGGFAGAVLVWMFFKDHYDATPDGDTKLGTFCTIPAIRNKGRNLLSEIVGTFVLLFCILAIGNKANTPELGLGSLGAFPVAFLIVAIGMSLGGTTGYAINPARDLAPRLAHWLMPIKGKRDSDWDYAWVPVLGPIIGAAIAAGLYILVF